MTIKKVYKTEDEYENQSTFAEIRFSRNEVKNISIFLEAASHEFHNHFQYKTIKELQRGFEFTDKKMQECNLKIGL